MQRGRGQILRGRGQGRIIWPRGHTGLEALTSLSDRQLQVSSGGDYGCSEFYFLPLNFSRKGQIGGTSSPKILYC